ncbi:MAG: pantoate--beta-alanine ligase [Bacteroidia bacterium]|nr:MAG: pantoate--beta-alanine ligase [Bacteroidia bacterium]
MLQFESKLKIKEQIYNDKQNNKHIGFVPTMGALHSGHLSLVEQSKKENDVTVVSIYVNPTQFNDPNDLKKYPRSLEKDLEILRKYECDYVFVPNDAEMYPEKDTRVFDFGELDKIMEGKHRAGHFNGVAQIVSKLFEIIKPDNAYFGFKDYQQYMIIKQMVLKLNMNINIIACPIVRESDGLAMSSRNLLLSPEERKNAAVISQVLFKAKEKNRSIPIPDLKKQVVAEINNNPMLSVEYFEIVDETDMSISHEWQKQKKHVGCIAVNLGTIRLIDNIVF